MARKNKNASYDAEVARLRSNADAYEQYAAEYDRAGKHDLADGYLLQAGQTRGELNRLHERGPGNE